MEGQYSYLCSSSTNWKKVRVLARGSYGVVFLAIQTKGPFDLVAVKAAPLERSSTLEKEKHILKNFIGCPEIVQFIGSEVIIDGYCPPVCTSYNLIMEYAPGGTLADLMICSGKFSESEAKAYLRMILRGLSSIHSKGFVHGDLKPANILVFPERDGTLRLKIADFGLSGMCEETNGEMLKDVKFRGTPRYMSPESVYYGTIDAPLDVWSLGCILIEMVSGRPVWGDCRDSEQLVKMIAYYREYPEIPDDLSIEGIRFLSKCLNQNCKERWTAEMLLQHPYVMEDRRRENDGDLKEDDPLLSDIAKLTVFDDLIS